MIKILLVLCCIVMALLVVVAVSIYTLNHKMKRLTLEERLELVYKKYEKKMKSEGMAFLIEDRSNLPV